MSFWQYSFESALWWDENTWDIVSSWSDSILFCPSVFKWINHPRNRRYDPTLLPDLLKLQRYFRNRKLRRFVRYTTSQAFAESFFHPQGKGGQWHKARMFKSIQSTL